MTRRGSCAGTAFAWLLIAGLCIAFWRWALVIGLPIVAGLVAVGVVRSRRAPVPRPVAALDPPRWQRLPDPPARCGHCGAPPGRGWLCRYCGTPYGSRRVRAS